MWGEVSYIKLKRIQNIQKSHIYVYIYSVVCNIHSILNVSSYEAYFTDILYACEWVIYIITMLDVRNGIIYAPIYVQCTTFIHKLRCTYSLHCSFSVRPTQCAYTAHTHMHYMLICNDIYIYIYIYRHKILFESTPRPWYPIYSIVNSDKHKGQQ